MTDAFIAPHSAATDGAMEKSAGFVTATRFPDCCRRVLRAGHKLVTYLHDNVRGRRRADAGNRRMKVVTSRAFNQDVSQAKRFARSEPVFVTDRGRPTHVLLDIDAYRRLVAPPKSILDLLAQPDAVEVEPARTDAWQR